MRFCPVALVAGKSVGRIFPIHFLHICIPRYFGENTGSRDGDTLGVSLYDRHLQDIHSGDRYGIIDKNIRTDGELSDGSPHGLISRLKDIDLIDPIRRHHDDRPGKCLFFDLREQHFPALLGHLLGVIQIRQKEILRQDDSRCCDRACQRSAPGLINSADQTLSAR